MKSFRSSEEPGEPVPELNGDDSSLFGFELDGSSWMNRVGELCAPDAADTLGPYTLLEEVSRGAQGIVYRALQPGTGRQVALKRLILGRRSRPVSRARFEREIDAASSLNHPGIVTVYAAQEIDGAPVFSMEWIEGQPFSVWAREIIAGAGATKVRDAQRTVLRCFLEVCDAVHHAHQHGLLHRDLKPSNILVDGEDRPHVLDFGLAKWIDDDETLTLTGDGGVLGTPAYAAPEQFGGTPESADARCDVYSAGVILYEALTGRTPYSIGGGLRALMASFESESYALPSTLDRQLGRELDAILGMALATERDRRYASVDALASDVRSLLAGQPVRAHPPTAAYQLGKIVRRHKAVASLAVALFLGAIGAAAFFARQADVISTAHEEAQEAREEMEGLAIAEGLARERAEDAAERAAVDRRRLESVLHFMIERVLKAADPVRAARDIAMIDVIVAAAGNLDAELDEDPLAEAMICQALAHVCLSQGEHRLGADLSARAMRRFDETGERHRAALSARDLASALSQFGGIDDAVALVEARLEQFDGAQDADRKSRLALLAQLSRLRFARREFDEALAGQEECLALTVPSQGVDSDDSRTLRMERAATLAELGRGEESVQELRALDAWYRAGDEFGRYEHIAVLEELATALRRGGDTANAVACMREVLEMSRKAFPEGHVRVRNAMVRLAHYNIRFDKVESLNLARAVYRDAPRDEEFSFELMNATKVYATALRENGETEGAIAVFRESLDQCRGIHPDDPTMPRVVQLELGELLVGAARYDEAIPVLEEALAGFVASGDPDRYAQMALTALGNANAGAGTESVASFDRHIAFLSKIDDRTELARQLTRYAMFRRRSLDDEDGARELEARARTLAGGTTAAVGVDREDP